MVPKNLRSKCLKTETFLYDCLMPQRIIGTKDKEISDKNTFFWVRYFVYGLFRKCMKSWGLVTCQYSMFSLSIAQAPRNLIWPCPSPLLIAKACMRKLVLPLPKTYPEEWNFFPSYLAEQQNKNSHWRKGAKYCGDFVKCISWRTSVPDKKRGKNLCVASPDAWKKWML